MNRPATNPRRKPAPALPIRHAAIKGRHRHQQHQRIHRQQVSRQQRAAQHAEERRIGQKQQKDAPATPGRTIAARSWPSASVRGFKQQRGKGHPDRHKQVHVQRQVQPRDGQMRPRSAAASSSPPRCSAGTPDCRREIRSWRSDTHTSRPAARRSSRATPPHATVPRAPARPPEALRHIRSPPASAG